jgi:hypothetical protein
MTAAVLREELHAYIDDLPDRSLPVLKPLLSFLVEPEYTIEPASPEECAIVEERVREYHENPSSFVPLSSR